MAEMIVKRISAEEYKSLFPAPLHVFNQVEFNELNKGKVDDVHYLIFLDGRKVRFGIILGEKKDVLQAPFSAPFGAMEERGVQRLSHYMEAVELLRMYADSLNRRVRLTLPPSIYDKKSVISKQFCSVLTRGGDVVHADYNYHYPIGEFPDFKDRMWPEVRNKFSGAMRQNFDFEVVSSDDIAGVSTVYSIISRNHTALGYPLHMSESDIINTSAIIKMDFFIVRHEGCLVAGGMVYHTSSCGRQVIYWGDVTEHRVLRPMNFLAFKVLEYYHTAGDAEFLDIGPSSSDGIPSLGLCDFKEGIGCQLTPKFTVELK